MLCFPKNQKNDENGDYMMRNYVNPNLTIISLSVTDVLCTSGILPEINNEVPGLENDTPAVSIF